jgi:hypothetical protein
LWFDFITIESYIFYNASTGGENATVRVVPFNGLGSVESISFVPP